MKTEYLKAIWSCVPRHPLEKVLFSEKTSREIENHFLWAAYILFPRATANDLAHVVSRSVDGPEQIDWTKDLLKMADDLPLDTIKWLIDQVYYDVSELPSVVRSPVAFISGLRDDVDVHEDRMRLALHEVLAFFEQSDEVRLHKVELMIIYCRAILRQRFSNVAPLHSAGTLATFDTILHVCRFAPMRNDGKAYNEHLRHQCFVFYLGLQILKRFRPDAGSMDGSLCDVVKDMLLRYVQNAERIQGMSIELNTSATKLLEMLETDMFVVEVWALISLFHDHGYYVSILLDIYQFNSVRHPIDGKAPLFVIAMIGKLFDVAKLHELDAALREFIWKCAPYIPHDDRRKFDHFNSTADAIDTIMAHPLARHNQFSVAERGEFHSFWTCAELWERFAVLKRRADDRTSEEIREQFSIALAIRAIYPYHFVGPREVQEAHTNKSMQEFWHILDLEERTELRFEVDPLGFLLILVDNIQTFSRFKFKALDRKTHEVVVVRKGKRRAAKDPRFRGIAVAYEELDLQCALDENEEYVNGERVRILSVELAGTANEPTRAALDTFKHWMRTATRPKGDGAKALSFAVSCNTDGKHDLSMRKGHFGPSGLPIEI